MRRSIAAALTAVALAGCGASTQTTTTGHWRPLPPDYVPVGIGPTAAWRPAPTSAAVRAGAPTANASCSSTKGPRYGAHLEVFVDDHVLAIPAGIGIEPPFTKQNTGRLTGGRCFYPAITTDPTGVIELTTNGAHTLGQLFAIWGQPLTATRLASFRISAHRPLVAYVGTRRWTGSPAAIILRRHTRVVLELRSRIPPHRTYVFPPGL